MQTSLRSSYQYYDYASFQNQSQLSQIHDNSQQQLLHHQQPQQQHQQSHHQQQQQHCLLSPLDNIFQSPNHPTNQAVSNFEPQELQHLNQNHYQCHSLVPICYTDNQQAAVEHQPIIESSVTINQNRLIEFDHNTEEPSVNLQQTNLLATNSANDVNDTVEQLKSSYHQPITYQTIYYEPVHREFQENHCNNADLQSMGHAFSVPNEHVQPTNEHGTYFQTNHYVQSGSPIQIIDPNSTYLAAGRTIQDNIPHAVQSQLYQTLQPSGINNYDDNLDTHQEQHQHQTQQLHQHESIGSEEVIDNIRKGDVQGLHLYLNSESTSQSISKNSFSSAASVSSISSSEDSCSSVALTRDERRAKAASIPMTYYEIVNLTIDQFNEQLSRHNLSESQVNLIKDIRRRGKNKVAAQSCRKRKMEQIFELQREVNQLANKRRSLNCECNNLVKEHHNLTRKYDKIYAIIRDRMPS